jgi:folate-binding protein YgfZ
MASNPLHSIHEQAEAEFLPYGPEIEIVETYGEPEGEYAAIRKGVAMMDAPHRAVVVLTGKDRIGFLQNKISADVTKLAAGQGCYGYFLNVKGRIQQDMNILHGEDATLLEMDARLAAGFARKLEEFRFGEDVRVLDASEQLGRLTLIGPRAGELLRKVDGEVESLGEPFRHGKRTIAKAVVTVFRNDLCGESQYELIVPRDQMVNLWQVLHEAGTNVGDPSALEVRAIGWAAFNIARIEAGSPLLGIDITETTLPMETGWWYLRGVSVTKGCYIGQEVVARMHSHNTVARMLVGLKVAGGKLPMSGTEIFDGTGQVGMVTSSCVSPMLGGEAVALGFVKRAYAAPGRVVEVLAEGGRAKGVVVELPLWKKKQGGS